MRFVFTSKRASNFFLSASTVVEGFFSATHVSKSSVNLHTSSIVIFSNSQVVHSSREIFHFFVGMWTFKDLPSIKSNQISSNAKQNCIFSLYNTIQLYRIFQTKTNFQQLFLVVCVKKLKTNLNENLRIQKYLLSYFF